ncbi:hypothetical protein BJ138DRAFT_1079270 [Hygrophoropsis aurantiaca]|uniref:Uncharacterized protein n=1 Tax=Hygrophoropsis aurantiaca TaxID=72124 RepID=A0ACB8AMQ9_9AGAM|nr:hypothetical protein BJ138DRAFT_1079270 [Hygrophoropsis aurantiaca]
MAPATPYTPLTSSKPTLADLLTIEPSASIFYSYAREVEISSRFAQGQGEDLTVLVPTNKAIMALARKPHQGPAPAEPTIEDDSEISEQELDERSKKNVQQWILAHIIPARISLDQFPVTYETLLDSKSVTFSSADMLEGGVRIVRTADVSLRYIPSTPLCYLFSETVP